MYNWHFSVPSQPNLTNPISVAPNQSTIVGLLLFVLFAFTLIANLYQRQETPNDQEIENDKENKTENQLEAQRQMLERIWNASSTMER